MEKKELDKVVVYNYTEKRDKETGKQWLEALKELEIEVFE